MALRWKNFVPNTPLKSSEVNDLANNGCVQIDLETDLDDASLVGANMAFSLDTFTLHTRIAAGVGADKWQKAGAGSLPPAIATGGTETTITDNGKTYRVVTFTANGTLTVTKDGLVDFLVVGGGGGGGGCQNQGNRGAGGGGGGQVLAISPMFAKAGTYPIIVGAGGSRGLSQRPGMVLAGPGGLSSALGITALGGGKGGHMDGAGPNNDGGSGANGGGGADAIDGQGQAGPSIFPAGMGYAGSPSGSNLAGGGGGGATGDATSAETSPGANGGPGYSSTITGTPVVYAAGGHGGAGPDGTGVQGVDGANGSGGGGGWRDGSNGGQGGAGVVIVRYEI